LEVSGEGVGFDTGEKFIAPRSWGLAGMKENIKSVGGRFEVRSEAGRGITIICLMLVDDHQVIRTGLKSLE
jgi:signal transduction histidine kinase